MNSRTPIALTIAGSDSSGGAGIQADLKTFAALGVYSASVITALTAQNTTGVSGVFPVSYDFIGAQFDAVVSDLAVTAIKTGMLGDAKTVEIVANLLRKVPNIPLVVDPVMVATSGDVLLSPDAIDVVRDALIPLANLITPNLPEAAKLLKAPLAQSTSDMQRQAEALAKLGCRAVLIKGGHGEGVGAIDCLFDGETHLVLERPRIETRNTHGTGCTLSAAITAKLAEGAGLIAAIEAGKAFVWESLNSAKNIAIGTGHGPLLHHFAMKKKPIVDL